MNVSLPSPIYLVNDKKTKNENIRKLSLSIIIVGYHLDINRGLALDYMKDEPIVIFYTT